MTELDPTGEEGASPAPKKPNTDVAIVGLAGRFPGARNIDEFWENLRGGVESIVPLSEEQLLAAGVSRAQLADPAYVRACPLLADVDKFDAGFFGFSPRDASVTDPAHRFFLEVVYEALEHSGNTGLPEEGTVAVFAGSGASYYYMDNVRTNPALMRSMGEFLVRHTGNDMNFLATRASYEFDFRGPGVNVQTACSSALVSLHLACKSLFDRECDMAIIGGATIQQPHNVGYQYSEGEIVSPDGHCRPFDARSAGTVFGSGAGALVLKRLDDALDNGDTIHAVVRGSAVNNDGAVKVGFLAPGVEGQVGVVVAALKMAGLSAEDIGFVEAHGTGTRVGDPIELTALQQAYETFTQKKQFCGVGSVKSNIGHLGEAAAAASLIKMVLSLKYRELPATLGYESPNEQFDMQDSPFFVNAELRPWEPLRGQPLRCGVTALGAGGTNCHVILEEPPAPLPSEVDRTQHLLCLSARSATALDAMTERFASAFESEDRPDLADAAYTLAVGRRAHPHRRVLVAGSAAQAAARMHARDRKEVFTSTHDGATPKLVFMFPGGGAQYARMGYDLYDSEPVYRDAIDECLAIANPVVGCDLAALLYPPEERASEATRALESPSLTLPALFSTGYALAQLFLSWGMEPAALLGHSMGEYIAACLAEVFSLGDALSLVMLRGRLFERGRDGGMVSVSLSEADTRELMPDPLSIAAVNAPDLCVASGPVEAIRAFEETLRARDIDFTHVHIDVAAHSSMLEPILDEFREACRRVSFSPPTLPFPSNLTGTWIEDGQATDPEYWVQHLRNTVRFADCVNTLLADGECAMVEVGPGRTLSSLARAQVNPVRFSTNSMRHPKEAANDVQYALLTLGKVWMTGVDVDMHALYADDLCNRVPLPRYPFDKQAFWVEPGRSTRDSSRDAELVKRENTDEWFYGMSWMQRPLAAEPPEREGGTPTWLVFEDGYGLAKKLRAQLGDVNVIGVVPGDELKQLSDARWQIDPASFSQFRELFEQLGRDQLLPSHIVYMWGISVARKASSALRGLFAGTRARIAEPSSIVKNFHALVNVGRAIGELEEAAELSVVTNRSAQLLREWIDPLTALQLGPVLVIPREFPLVRTRCIDVALERAIVGLDDGGVRQLVRELRGASADRVVALRSGLRWVRSVEPTPLASAPEARRWVRAGGVYVITGGLGGIGLTVATSLAKTRGVKLALLGRSGLPDRSRWEALLSAPAADPRTVERIQKVRALEEAGAVVLPVAADVTDAASLARGLEQVRSTLGPICGVLHAAGRMDDAPMQTKSVTAMDAVLAAKVLGTRLLDHLIDEPLDFFVLFSSIASFVGLPGQVDYTAANAFQDAFARERSLREKGRTVVINWSAWRDVGMAAQALEEVGRPPPAGDPCDHPALDGVTHESDAATFHTDFSIESHWLLSEHQLVDSKALIPGTGFLELIRAAFAVDHPTGAIEMSDLTFVSPFQVDADERRRLSIRLSPAGEVTEVVLYSTAKEHPHVVGNVRRYPGAAPAPLDLSAIAARCPREQRTEDRFLDQHFVRFGPRWANIDVIRYGDGEALSELSLDPAFESDLTHYKLHPAVMDMATGGCQPLIEGFDPETQFYVPLSYQTVRVFGDMPRRCFSHVRAEPPQVEGLAGFDVTLTDSAGRVFAEIKRFVMKRVDPASVGDGAQRAPGETAGSSALAAVLREAIAPEEGVRVLDRILAQPDVVQVVASSVDPVLWTRQLDAQAEGGGEEGAEALVFERPAGAGEYVEPQGATQKALAKMWSELLGIKEVGTTDEFFDLGGDSLVAVRLMRRIKKAYGLDFGIARLFEAPDIESLSVLIDGLSAAPAEALGEDAQNVESVERIAALEEWGLRPVWEERAVEGNAGEQARTWLLFMDEAGVGAALERRLKRAGQTVLTVLPGDTFSKRPGGAYTIAPERGRRGYDELLEDLQRSGSFPTHVLHLWLVTSTERFRPGSSFFHENLQQGFYSLFYLAQALDRLRDRPPVHVMGVTSGAQAIAPGERIEHPEKATIRGPLMSLPRELPGVTSTHVDVGLPDGSYDVIVRALHREALMAAAGETVALRVDRRYVRRLEALPLPEPASPELAPGGVYAITGGTSGRGLALAGALVDLGAKLALLCPEGLPDESRWPALIVDDSTDPALARSLRGLMSLRERSADVMILAAPIIDELRTAAALTEVTTRFGRIDGVFHCEGEPTAAPIAAKTEIDVEDMFAAKVHGTLALAPLAEAAGARALVLFSSSGALTAPAGVVEQLAGDAFLDAYAASRPDGGMRVLSIDWGPWVDPSRAAEASALGARADAGEQLSVAERLTLHDAELAIRPEEGASALDRALAAPALPQLWISPIDYRGSLARAEVSRARVAVARADAADSADAGAGEMKHLVPMHRGNAGDKTPFFLVAGMFGNVLNLRYLANLVGTDRKFYGVQAKGLFGGEAPNRTFEAMAEDYLREIREVQPHGPYMLGGFSGGGIAAYEMAQRLRAEGEEIAILLMIDTPLPQRRGLNAMDRVEIQVQRLQRKGLGYVSEWARDRARWELGKLRARFGGDVASASSEDQFHNEAIQEAFLHACAVYQVRRYEGHLTLFRPKPDRHYVLRDGRVLDVAREHVFPDNGWTPFVDKLDVYEMPGGHDSMVLEPNVRVMAARLRQCIAEAERAHPPRPLAASPA